MPTKSPKTLIEFNEYLTQFFKTVLPEPLRVVDWNSYKRAVYDVVFGAGWKTFQHGKQLTAPDDFKYEDSPTGAIGVKATGFKESFFVDAIKEIDILQTDPTFIAELKDLLAKDPLMKNEVKRALDKVLYIFINRRAKCKLLIEQEYAAEMEQQAIDMGDPDLVFGFLEPPTPTSKYTKFIKRVKDIVSNITYSKAKNLWKTAVQIKDKIETKIGNSFSIVSAAAAFRGARKVFGKLPILLGPVPLKHVDYVEVARSGKILKFRATGSVFLAKQEGGADAIKIEGIMYKIEFLIMFLLWGLFIYGQSKFKDMDKIVNPPGVTDIFEIRKLNDLIMTDTTLQRPSYEFHRTFPFVSRHFIIPNCYIETISIEDKLPLKDVLKYSILLRTYDKPKQVNFVEGKKGKSLYGIANKTLSAKICEASLNAGWRMLNASGWLLDETEWKIGSATEEGVLDTYYDVDWSTIATMSYLTLMGAVT